MTTTTPREQAVAAWTDYCESLKAAGQQLLRTDFPVDDLDLAEGLRYLSRLLYTSVERHIEGADPARPLLYLMCSERVKVGGDNPDNRYFAAAVSHRYRYVLRGDFRRCSYFSVVTTGKVDGTENVVCGALNSEAAVMGADGVTEIIIGGGPDCANHVATDERTSLLIVRCTIEEAGDRNVAVTLSRCDTVETQTTLDVVTVAQGLQNSAAFVRNVSSFFGDWTARFQETLNTLPAYRDQRYLVSIGGDPNIHYYLSAWSLSADQCLVIHIPEIPPATTWNCQLCNVWLESLDYTLAQIHVNSRTAARDRDGGVTIVVSERDPGHPNWLRTLGHRQGTMCLRLVGAARPLVANTRVAVLSTLKL